MPYCSNPFKGDNGKTIYILNSVPLHPHFQKTMFSLVRYVAFVRNAVLSLVKNIHEVGFAILPGTGGHNFKH